MTPSDVLLLALGDAPGVKSALLHILRSVETSSITVHEGSASCHDARDEVQRGLPDLVARIRPAVSFLVSPLDSLCHAARFLQCLRERELCHPVVVVSNPTPPRQMLDLLHEGAADFSTTPLKSSEILVRLWRLLEPSSWFLSRSDRGPRPSGAPELIGRSAQFAHIIDTLPLIAQHDTTVLISGETGTGKEVCARAIHGMSARSTRPFIPVNCGAIPTELIENELFGHERGAYTSAEADHSGLITEADGGTLFLDEIDALPLMAQVKLLRFLQDKEFKPLGSSRVRRGDVRVITATNIDMEQAVHERRIRQDLYYRLNIIPLALPPLRERREDIVPLAELFLATYAAKFHKDVRGFSEAARRKLLTHDWPGNVRELEHVVERATALTTDRLIDEPQLSVRAHERSAGPLPFQVAKAKVVTEFERTYLQALLMAYNGNVTRAAEAAQKDRSALCQLLRKHHIVADDFRQHAGLPPSSEQTHQ